MAKTVRASNRISTRDRARQEEWRARLPEVRRIVEDVGPRMLEEHFSRRPSNFPSAWTELVASMKQDVHSKAETARSAASKGDGETIEELRGYEWSFKVGTVSDMIDVLLETIRKDIGLVEGRETLASIALVQKALLQLNLELQDGGTKTGREDRDENRYRVLAALRALTPRFDDLHLQRIRALETAERCARYARLPGEDDVAERVAALAKEPHFDPERHREFMTIDEPVLGAVLARHSLAEIDGAFSNLDPLLVLEELAEASTGTAGGKNESGDGRIGPVRALARLAVTCRALGFGQRDGESFDAAVDRARGNLLMTRSRVRKAARDFAGRVSGS